MKIALGIMIAAQLFTMPAMTMDTTVYEGQENVEIYAVSEEPTRQEQFEWYYRIYNGHQQKRLWSLTYGYWVTDWIDC